MFAGTSIVASILGAHPQVAIISEWKNAERRILGKPIVGIKLLTWYQIRTRTLKKYIQRGYEIIWVWRNYDEWIESWCRRIKGRKWHWRLFWSIMPKKRVGKWYYEYSCRLWQCVNKKCYDFHYSDFLMNKKCYTNLFFTELGLECEDVLEQAEKFNYPYPK